VVICFGLVRDISIGFYAGSGKITSTIFAVFTIAHAPSGFLSSLFHARSMSFIGDFDISLPLHANASEPVTNADKLSIPKSAFDVDEWQS
jgi:hypothetical protein